LFGPLSTCGLLNVFSIRAVSANVAATIASSQEVGGCENNLAILLVKILRFEHSFASRK
jgi:hypothetical protein